MQVSEILNYDFGTEVYVVKKIDIKWNTMRFYNTDIKPTKYIVAESKDQSFFTPPKILKKEELGNNHPTELKMYDTDYESFLSEKEAEIWKIVELQGLDDLVNEHIESLKQKTENKLKKLKKSLKLDEYIEKYPETVLKVI